MFLSFSSITTGANNEAGTTFRITWVSWDSCFAITFLCCALRTVFSSWPLYFMSFDISFWLLLWYRQSFLANSLSTDNKEYWCSALYGSRDLIYFEILFYIGKCLCQFFTKIGWLQKFWRKRNLLFYPAAV